MIAISSDLHAARIDFEDLQSERNYGWVRAYALSKLANVLFTKELGLHLLVHSAGIVQGHQELTDEGIESNFAVNYLARFALTTRLLPSLLAAGTQGNPALVLVVGGAARDGTVHFDDPNLTARFGTVRAVAQFCQANDVFTVELARRLGDGGLVERATVTSLKLGVVKTNIRRTSRPTSCPPR